MVSRGRQLLVVFGVLIALGGAVWALQGAGVIGGSFMSNNPTWIGIGAATVVVGAALAAVGLWPRSRAKKT